MRVFEFFPPMPSEQSIHGRPELKPVAISRPVINYNIMFGIARAIVWRGAKWRNRMEINARQSWTKKTSKICIKYTKYGVYI